MKSEIQALTLKHRETLRALEASEVHAQAITKELIRLKSEMSKWQESHLQSESVRSKDCSTLVDKVAIAERIAKEAQREAQSLKLSNENIVREARAIKEDNQHLSAQIRLLNESKNLSEEELKRNVTESQRRMNEAIDKLKSENRALRQELESTIDSLREKALGMTTVQATLRRTKQDLDDQRQSQELIFKRLGDEISLLYSQLQHSKTTESELRDSSEKLKQQHRIKLSDLVESSDMQLKGLRAELLKLMESNTLTKRELSTSLETNTKLAQAIKLLEEDRNSLRKAETQLEKKYSELLSGMTQMQHTVASEKSLRIAAEADLMASDRKLASVQESLTSSTLSYERQSLALTAVHHELDSLQQSCASLRAENLRQVDEIESLRVSSRKKSEETAALNSEFERTRSDCDERAVKLRRQEDELTTLTQHVQQRIETIEELQSQLRQREKDATATRKLLQEKDNRIEDLLEQCQRQDNEAVSLRRVAQGRADHIDELKTQVKKLQDDVASLRRDIQERNQAMSELQSQYDRKEEEAVEASRALRERSSRVASLETRVHELDEALAENERDRRDVAQNHVHELRNMQTQERDNAARQYQVQIKSFHEKIQELQNSMREMYNDMEAVRADRSASITEIEHLRLQLRERVERVEQLEHQIEFNQYYPGRSGRGSAGRSKYEEFVAPLSPVYSTSQTFNHSGSPVRRGRGVTDSGFGGNDGDDLPGSDGSRSRAGGVFNGSTATRQYDDLTPGRDDGTGLRFEETGIATSAETGTAVGVGLDGDSWYRRNTFPSVSSTKTKVDFRPDVSLPSAPPSPSRWPQALAGSTMSSSISSSSGSGHLPNNPAMASPTPTDSASGDSFSHASMSSSRFQHDLVLSVSDLVLSPDTLQPLFTDSSLSRSPSRTPPAPPPAVEATSPGSAVANAVAYSQADRLLPTQSLSQMSEHDAPISPPSILLEALSPDSSPLHSQHILYTNSQSEQGWVTDLKRIESDGDTLDAFVEEGSRVGASLSVTTLLYSAFVGDSEASTHSTGLRRPLSPSATGPHEDDRRAFQQEQAEQSARQELDLSRISCPFKRKSITTAMSRSAQTIDIFERLKYPDSPIQDARDQISRIIGDDSED